MKKFLIFLLTVCLSFASLSNLAYAATTEEQSAAQPETMETAVTANIASNYSIKIPKSINIDSETKSSTYTVEVSGDISNKEKVTVVPESSFTMSQTNANDVTATVSQDKTTWTNKDIAIVGNGIVSAPDITAGKWIGSFMFNITLKSTAVTVVSATDTNGTDLNASAAAIEGAEKEQLLNGLLESGLIGSIDDVDAIIDVQSDAFNDLADTVFDVSNIAQTGDKVTILHYDETKGEWEYIGTEEVDANGQISGNFTNYSPVVFVKVESDGTMGHVHNYVDGMCSCGDVEHIPVLKFWKSEYYADVDHPITVYVSLDNKTLYSGVTWSSDNNDVSITNGNVTFNSNVKPGDTANITAEYNGLTTTAKLTFIDIQLSKNEIYVTNDTSDQVYVNILPESLGITVSNLSADTIIAAGGGFIYVNANDSDNSMSFYTLGQLMFDGSYGECKLEYEDAYEQFDMFYFSP